MAVLDGYAFDEALIGPDGYSDIVLQGFDFSPPEAAAVSLPTTTIVSPLEGSTITRTTPLVFTVTDSVALRRVIVTCQYAESLPEEVVHNGDAFSPTYVSATNVRASITGGYQYTILRDGGWPSSPKLTVYAVNVNGYEYEFVPTPV